ncbi:MAG: MATE family efflux transporter [Lachnospiraceae bacterium]|nr:MATE family efflux transporter [Lachnospiraceae bacterium]MDD3659870.1 MATE family efflux transporter [Lachnospiraceae bacterium]
MELDMTKGNPLKLIIRFMVPLIIGNIFQQLYNMADTIIVGRYVGVKALAAVGSTGTIMFLIIGFMQGMTTGFTILTSQRFGSGDMAGLRKSVGNAAVLSAIVTIIGTIVSVYFMDGLLKLMNTPSDIFQDAKEYITIICIGLVCNILYNLLASILRAVGNSKVPLYFLVVAAVMNVFLDLFFIIQFNMGVAGAAWATVISQGVSGILCLLYIMKKVPVIHIKKEDWKLDYYCVRNQISIGIPMALQFSITAIGTILVQSALNMLGSVAVAAYTAAGKVEQFVTQPFLALGMTMATYCAQNTGVDDVERVRKGVRIANIMSAIYGVCIAFVVVAAMPYLVTLFVTGDAGEIIQYANTYIRITSVFFVPLGLIFIFRNVFQGCGYSFVPLMGGVVELLSRAVLAFVAASLLSFKGVCFANAAAWITAGGYLGIAYLFAIRKWQKTGSIFKR